MRTEKSDEPRPSRRLLPPIARGNEGASPYNLRPRKKTPDSSTSSSPEAPPVLPSSKYHRGCVSCNTSVSPRGSGRGRGRKRDHVKQGRHLMESLQLVPYKAGRVLNSNDDGDMMETYVLENVNVETIRKWLFKKSKIVQEAHDDVKSAKNIVPSPKQIFEDLMDTLKCQPEEQVVIRELVRCVTDSIGVDAYRIYQLNPDQSRGDRCWLISYVSEDSSLETDCTDPQCMSFVLEVAKSGVSLCLTRGEDDCFPETPVSVLQKFEATNVSAAQSVVYQAILIGKEVSYVAEMWRATKPFTNSDLEKCNTFLWAGLALFFYNLNTDNEKQKNTSGFLLEVVKAIFEKMVTLDALIKRILEFAQNLVNADRASLFLVDSMNSELVSTVFDQRFEPGQAPGVQKEIRVPINRGIAGHVASSGETMNIPDAYADHRFNCDVDVATGYKTINILCMPIKVQGEVIGVVQMVNKRNDNRFRREDEVAFEVFATYFGLALHYARLYDTIMRKEQKYRVALEVLSYHNTCRESEVEAIMVDKNQLEVALDDFYLDPYKLDEFDKCKAVLVMFDDLFDMSKFDKATVTRFVLTVKKNYRTVPYHNFDHGWTVAHTMYVILKNEVEGRFDYKMRLALFVASLCHDLDHRGYTNKYMSETASPLAAMYTTSTLEHHHFNITVTILQQDGHNIFSHMSSDEYKVILGYIRQCILATDLAAFFPNLAKMKELHSGEPSHAKFSWADPSHRDLSMAISMTAADLSAAAKPWDVQNKTVKVIFEEFYDQGDKERAANRTPIPMMDRNLPDEQPSSQVGFLSQICIPCYNILHTIIPATKPMYSMALSNLHNWESKAACILNKRNAEIEENSQTENNSEKALLNGDPEIFEEDVAENDAPKDKSEIRLNESTESENSLMVMDPKAYEEIMAVVRQDEIDNIIQQMDNISVDDLKELDNISLYGLLNDQPKVVTEGKEESKDDATEDLVVDQQEEIANLSSEIDAISKESALTMEAVEDIDMDLTDVVIKHVGKSVTEGNK